MKCHLLAGRGMISVEKWGKMLQCNRGWSFSLCWIPQQHCAAISNVIKNSCTFSFLAWSVAFLPCFDCRSILLSLLTGRDWSHCGKGGEGRSCMCFSPLRHLTHCCMTVINRGAPLQGQPGAMGAIGVKGQKVSDIGGRRSSQCLGLFVLWERQVEQKQFKLWYYAPNVLWIPVEQFWIGICKHQQADTYIWTKCYSRTHICPTSGSRGFNERKRPPQQ